MKKLVLLLWIVILGSAIYAHLYFGKAFSEYGDLLQLGLEKSGYWAPVIFVILYTIRPVIFFPATVLTIGAGVVFGSVFGYIYTIIGAIGSAAFGYGMGIFLGSDLIDKIPGNWAATFQKKIQKESFMTTLMMRLLYLPFDPVAYIAGISRAQFVPFLFGTFLGILPGTATFVLFGGAVGAAIEGEENPPVNFLGYEIPYKFFKIGVIVLISIFTFLFSYLLSRWLRKRSETLEVLEK